jgi:hypothetical protein
LNVDYLGNHEPAESLAGSGSFSILGPTLVTEERVAQRRELLPPVATEYTQDSRFFSGGQKSEGDS